MPLTMKDVQALLDPEEVDYSQAKKLGPDAVPYLMELVRGGDLALASKAAYLAGMIPSDQAVAVVAEAAKSHEPVLRVAAASTIRHLPEGEAEKLMDLMKSDDDPGIRKMVLKSVAELKSPNLLNKIQEIAEKDPEPFVRDFATTTLKEIKSKMK